MIFRHFLIDVNESNAYVVACETTRQALLVDVAAFDAALGGFLEDQGLTLTTIFITHDHYDHTGGLQEALARYDAEVLAGKGSVGGCQARKVAHGDSVRIGELAGTVLATPGHTPEGVSMALPGVVFTGDALFSGSVGGTFSSQDARQQVDHIRKHIFSLPDDVEIYPGHGPPSTVGVERRYNPFFS